MRLFKNIKDRWNSYLKRLAEANSRNFGDQRLDCCSLNRDATEKEPAESSVNRHTGS